MQQFEKEVNKLKTAQAKQDKAIDDLLRNAIYHSVVNNQATPAIKLVGAFGKATRKNDVISFLCKYANIQHNQAEGITAKLKSAPEIKECWKDEEKSWAYAESIPSFWDVVKEQKIKQEWVLEEALHNLIRTYRSHLNKGHKTEIKAEDQDLLNSLLTRFPAKA